jgi:hypothetical protein
LKKNKRKKCKKKKSYKGIDLNTILLAAIIVIIIYGANQGWFGGQTFNFSGDQIDLFNTQGIDGTNQCKITFDKSSYCTGDIATANLNGPANTLFYIGLNQDNAGWELWGQETTDSDGKITQNVPVNEVGTFKIRAISDSCITNLVTVSVTNCGAQDNGDEENCWWQSIATESMEIPSGIILNWGTTLVEGKFKYEWNYQVNGVDTRIEGPSTAHESSSRDSYYEFDTTGGYWELQAHNDQLSESNADLELFQWVCEGDPLNWRPEMIGSMSEGGTECEIEQFTVTHGGYVGAADQMPLAPDSISNVLQSGVAFTDPADYIWDGAYTLDWSPGGKEPAPGSTYYLTVLVC